MIFIKFSISIKITHISLIFILHTHFKQSHNVEFNSKDEKWGVFALFVLVKIFLESRF